MGSTSNKGNKLENVSGLSKNKIKWIRSLQLKKHRDEEGVYLIEGEKIVIEAIENNPNDILFIAHSDHFQCPDFVSSAEIVVVSDKELSQISSLKTPNKAFAVLKKPSNKKPSDSGLILALDGIQDPGNMGTILRTADWFGIDEIICSKETVDCFNPKVVQASMGAIMRIKVYYQDLETFIANYNGPVYGAFLEGNNVYNTKLNENCVLLMGNEGKGISDGLTKYVTQKIHIPRFGLAESLNVAVATAILVSEIKRLQILK